MQLKNIAEPIRVYSLEVGVPAQAKSTPTVVTEKHVPPRLSIVVLPFANIGGDPEQEYFVDGVTESLTTDLSRIAGAFVIARNTAFTYKSKPIDVKTVGRELNVRYVLEGSVQRGGNRMRVNVQLVNSESGKHLWAERFDKPVADFFDMQDEIVPRLAAQLGTALIAAEARRAERTANPDAFDLYLQGMAWLDKDPRPVNVAQSRAFFGRAVAIEPDNVDALIGSAGANIRYVLEGSVQRGGNRMRIYVQLIDAESGDHLWAERFDNFAERSRPTETIGAIVSRGLARDRGSTAARLWGQAPDGTSNGVARPMVGVGAKSARRTLIANPNGSRCR